MLISQATELTFAAFAVLPERAGIYEARRTARAHLVIWLTAISGIIGTVTGRFSVLLN